MKLTLHSTRPVLACLVTLLTFFAAPAFGQAGGSKPNVAPVAQAVSVVVSNANTAQSIKPLVATDADGTIANYTIVSLPENWLGTLLLDGTAVKEGQELTPLQATQLRFRPTVSDIATASFTYTATDNKGSRSNVVTYTLSIKHDIDLTLTHTILTAGPFAQNQEIVLRYTVTNLGTSPVWDGVFIQNFLPAQLTFVRPIANELWRYEAHNNTWNMNGLGGKESKTVDIVASVNSAAAFTHTATVAILHPQQVDLNLTNNSTTLGIGIVPVAVAVETELDPDMPIAQEIPALTATTPSGRIVGYTLKSLPAATAGTLYVKGKEAVVNQKLSLEEASALSFKIAPGFRGPSASFTYTATNNFGMESATPATYSLLITGISPLPVELISFKATAQNNQVTLNWSTASEQDNDRFEVERSQDGRTFTKIGTVQGRGTSTLTNHYTFRDTNPGTGTNYYRLRQVDFDGTSELSKTVAATINAIAVSVRAYPNPFAGNLRVELATETTGTLHAMLLDLRGRVVLEQQVNLNGRYTELELNTQQLIKGTYILQIKGGGLNSTTKLMKQH